MALSLGSNLILVRAVVAGRSLNGVHGWEAAGLAVAALGTKQTALGLPVAQLIWLGWWVGPGALWVHLERGVVAGVGLGLIAGWQFGFRELWFGVVTVPGGLPMTEELGARLAGLAWPLSGHLLAAPLLWVMCRESGARDTAG